MDNAELAIGIDLGTTNSLIAVWKDGAAQLIPNKFGEYLTPSIISMDENNHILVGKRLYHGVLRIRIKRQRYLNVQWAVIPTGG